MKTIYEELVLETAELLSKSKWSTFDDETFKCRQCYPNVKQYCNEHEELRLVLNSYDRLIKKVIERKNETKKMD